MKTPLYAEHLHLLITRYALQGEKNKISLYFWTEKIQQGICNNESGFQAKCSNWRRKRLLQVDEQLKFWLRLSQQCRQLFFWPIYDEIEELSYTKRYQKIDPWSRNKRFCFVWNTQTSNWVYNNRNIIISHVP